MRTLLTLAASLGLAAPVSMLLAQTEAVTLAGDTVMLLDNGRWSFIENYREEQAIQAAPIDTLAAAFTTPPAAKRVEKSLDGVYTLRYNHDRWSPIDAAEINPMAEKAFVAGRQETFAMLIAERISYELEAYADALIGQVAGKVDELKLIGQDYRRVNGRLTLHTAYEVKASGLEFAFHRYLQQRDGVMLQYVAWRQVGDVASELSLFALLNGLD